MYSIVMASTRPSHREVLHSRTADRISSAIVVSLNNIPSSSAGLISPVSHDCTNLSWTLYGDAMISGPGLWARSNACGYYPKGWSFSSIFFEQTSNSAVNSSEALVGYCFHLRFTDRRRSLGFFGIKAEFHHALLD